MNKEENLDIDRIYNGLTQNGYKVLEIQAYLSYLKREYPLDFQNFQKKYKTIGCVKIVTKENKK